VRRGFGLSERAIAVLKGQLAPSRPFIMGMPVASGWLPVTRLADVGDIVHLPRPIEANFKSRSMSAGVCCFRPLSWECEKHLRLEKQTAGPLIGFQLKEITLTSCGLHARKKVVDFSAMHIVAMASGLVSSILTHLLISFQKEAGWIFCCNSKTQQLCGKCHLLGTHDHTETHLWWELLQGIFWTCSFSCRLFTKLEAELSAKSSWTSHLIQLKSAKWNLLLPL